MKIIFLACVSGLLLTISCQSREATTSPSARNKAAEGSDSRPVTVKGSDTMVILGQRFAEEYMKQNPGTVIQVNGGGSGTGIAALINGTVDLAQASRPMKSDEREQVSKQRHATLVENPVALDALAVFVHQNNPVRELSIEQLAGIYTGKTRNWNQVGGANGPIILYGRESSSGTYDYFKEHVLSKVDFSPTVQTLQGTAAIINAVARDAKGIGYGGIAYAKDVRAISIRASGKPTAVAPSERTVADGSYPLSRKLFFYTISTAPERVSRFVSWAVASEGQSVVKNVGYFPLSTTAPATSSPLPASTSSDAQSR